MNRLDLIEKPQVREGIPSFQAGDTVRVHVRIKEGNKERLQIFEGVCIARKHGSVRETVTIRKVSFGVGVERIFPVNATIIDHIDVMRRGSSTAFPSAWFGAWCSAIWRAGGLPKCWVPASR